MCTLSQRCTLPGACFCRHRHMMRFHTPTKEAEPRFLPQSYARHRTIQRPSLPPFSRPPRVSTKSCFTSRIDHNSSWRATPRSNRHTHSADDLSQFHRRLSFLPTHRRKKKRRPPWLCFLIEVLPIIQLQHLLRDVRLPRKNEPYGALPRTHGDKWHQETKAQSM